MIRLLQRDWSGYHSESALMVFLMFNQQLEVVKSLCISGRRGGGMVVVAVV